MMKKILVMAGGTGGHVFPGIAVAKELVNNSSFEVLWLGTKDHMEANLVPKNGFNIKFIDIQGIRRNGILRKICAPFKILKAILQSLKIIKEFKPDVVLGMGGYASGPGGVAAWLLGIPVVLHEQNACPGVTNKLLSKIAKKVLLGFPKAFEGKNVIYVGNPVRQEVIDIHDKAIKSYKNRTLNIAVIGGSLGAMVINNIVPQAFAKCLEVGADIKIIHQTGKGNLEKVNKLYKELNTRNYVTSEFIYDMANLYANTDLIICRAGALTVAEVSTAGIPAIFIPLPTAVDDHQTKNARVLADENAAICLPQNSLDSDRLFDIIMDLYNNPEKLEFMNKKTVTLARISATSDVANICKELAGA
ncbi:MAG: undecaprenyldiphospho-muramoylpentapeptide beta-N-acetylglucosaminyltransferase [Succinivibrionaceae bacterium]